MVLTDELVCGILGRNDLGQHNRHICGYRRTIDGIVDSFMNPSFSFTGFHEGKEEQDDGGPEQNGTILLHSVVLWTRCDRRLIDGDLLVDQQQL